MSGFSVMLALMWEAAEKMRHWVNVVAASIGIHLALVAVDVRRWFLDAVFVLSLAAGTLRVVEWYKVLKRLERVVSGDPAALLWPVLG